MKVLFGDLLPTTNKFGSWWLIKEINQSVSSSSKYNLLNTYDVLWYWQPLLSFRATFSFLWLPGLSWNLTCAFDWEAWPVENGWVFFFFFWFFFLLCENLIPNFTWLLSISSWKPSTGTSLDMRDLVKIAFEGSYVQHISLKFFWLCYPCWCNLVHSDSHFTLEIINWFKKKTALCFFAKLSSFST